MSHEGTGLMRELLPKTIGEHAEFLREMVKLQLWFVWRWSRLHPEEPFQAVIRTRNEHEPSGRRTKDAAQSQRVVEGMVS